MLEEGRASLAWGKVMALWIGYMQSLMWAWSGRRWGWVRRRSKGRKLGTKGKMAVLLVGVWSGAQTGVGEQLKLSLSLSLTHTHTLVHGVKEGTEVLLWVDSESGVFRPCERSVWGVRKYENQLKVKWGLKWFYKLCSQFYGQTEFYSQFDCIFKWCQTHTWVQIVFGF